MEMLPSTMYLQKWSQMEGVPSTRIFTKKLLMEVLPRAMYLQKWSWMEGVPSATYLQKSCRWKCFQAQHIYRKGPRGQDGIGCPLTSTPLQGSDVPTLLRIKRSRMGWDGIKVKGSNVASCSRVSLMKVCYTFWSMDVIPGLPWIVFHPKSFPFD